MPARSRALSSAILTPLLVRPGTRFVCHGDGVCCSDVHALGPIANAETIPLRRLMVDSVVAEPAVGGMGLRVDNGACVFLRHDNLCRVQAELGIAAKPATCRRYPFNLVATPSGMRVVTPHRCPCRTLGPRPLLTEHDVHGEISIPGVALEVDHHVGRELNWMRDEQIDFTTWCQREGSLLRQLAAGQHADLVLQTDPFADLGGTSWVRVAATLLTPKDASAFEVAKQWVAQAIFFLLRGRPWSPLTRPWGRFFDRAEIRLQAPQDADVMIADWLADEIWSLQWTQFGSFARGRRDLATRLAMVRAVADAMAAQGVRADRATAEALLVVDVITHSEHWYQVVQAIEEP